MSSTTIMLETVAAEDAESLAALRVESMRESLERVGRFDPERARARFLGTFTPEFTRAIVHDGERVGFTVVRPSPEGLLLDHLYVHPSRQNRGIGAAVLQAVYAEADAANLSIRVAALRGSESNRFYVSHGLEHVESTEFDNYYVRRPKSAL